MVWRGEATGAVAARVRKHIVSLALALELSNVALSLEQRVLLRNEFFAPVEAGSRFGKETLSIFWAWRRSISKVDKEEFRQDQRLTICFVGDPKSSVKFAAQFHTQLLEEFGLDAHTHCIVESACG
jgi:hypothetical protein